jgi:hypothetical protein
MSHVPLFCSDQLEGKSGTGLYGDVMMEIVWSVGEIMKSLKSAGVEDNTLVGSPQTPGHGGRTATTPAPRLSAKRREQVSTAASEAHASCDTRDGLKPARFRKELCARSICCQPWRNLRAPRCQRIQSMEKTCGI